MNIGFNTQEKMCEFHECYEIEFTKHAYFQAQFQDNGRSRICTYIRNVSKHKRGKYHYIFI